MNFNLPCFIPSYPHQQTAFVYVPLFQSSPQFNYYVQLQPFQTFVPQNELIQQLPQVEIPELNQTRVEQPQQKETEISSSTPHQSAIIDAKTAQDKPIQIQEKKSKSSNHLNNQVQFEKESKNIQKNYAKAIAGFVYKNKSLASKILGNQEVDEFIQLIKLIKNQIQNVSHISQYTNNQDFIKAFRILGNYFLRTKSNSYIFNSRILKKNSHLRHKKLIHHSLLRC
ncbi:unnamed protein product (macronuclear) [Paramecium tetraurelia]|uniref:Chromosome undetermined scaffold_1, whole genome shotgun sequence n=1 Tax=Paramecium tetraurelia TaxID=5888 RepID=Q6BFW1_PARTE|nr:hypothetical protein [Paramecium tetraurelia strain d4-2]XP_001423217.1 uncharacterized protein GSPATT00000254001 [Paramecium tetraurelia]CAH03459.1 hypothetical protein PTMB.261c [Paramecium tetraurelia]CAK55819.1 unnamed protein product [Paramecium tetraurelia]|eukprot:XP_001423217.1 hypothetical protein (macronuclear) [Paramecium tetraurelia strain d4-2]